MMLSPSQTYHKITIDVRTDDEEDYDKLTRLVDQIKDLTQSTGLVLYVGAQSLH